MFSVFWLKATVSAILAFTPVGWQLNPAQPSSAPLSPPVQVSAPLLTTTENAYVATPELPHFFDSASSQPAGCLFHPVPRSALTPMVTDRPGQTNGPFTIAPGHLQIETGLLSYTYDHGSRLNRADFFSQSEFRIGLVPDGEIDLVLNPFSWQRQDGISASGFGDTTLQGKWTAWTDVSGNAAFGVIPFITFSTSQHGLGAGGTQGGVFFPLAMALPSDFGLGVMPGAYAAHNRSGGYHTQVVASAAISHPIVGTLSAFGEFASSIDVKHASDWVGTVDFGVVYLITPDLQLDLGMNVGVTRAAPDVNPFVGLSTRF